MLRLPDTADPGTFFMRAPTPALKYRAFLSYAHADSAAAKRLHAALEAFPLGRDLAGRVTAQGPVPASLRPIFRDRDDFSGGHTLNDATIAALDASAALIVLCSPVAATRPAVNEEVRLFRHRHPGRPVIPVILSGRPNIPAPSPSRGEGEEEGRQQAKVTLWAAASEQPASHRNAQAQGAERRADGECFPPALRFELAPDGSLTDRPVTFLAPDLSADGPTLALAKIIATLTGFAPDDIYQRAKRAQRRQSRIRAAVLTAISVLTLGAGILAWRNREQVAVIAVKEQVIASKAEMEAEALAITRQMLGANPKAANTPGQQESLVAALKAIQESAAAGDADYTQALALLKAGKGADAVPLLLKAAEAKKAKAVQDNRAAAKAYREAAAIAAVAEPWRARDLYAEAARLDPDNIEGLYQHGWLNLMAGNLPVAEAALDRLLKVATTLNDQRGIYRAHLRLGELVQQRGDLTGARTREDAALGIAKAQTASFPSDLEWQRDLSLSYGRVGDVLVAQGNLPEALKSYRDSLVIADRLSKADAGYAGWQRDLSVSYERIGDMQVAQGNLPAALGSFRDYLAIAAAC